MRKFIVAALASAALIPAAPAFGQSAPTGLPTGTHFTSIELESEGGFTLVPHRDFKVDESGKITYETSRTNGVISDQATPDELKALNDAWATSKLTFGDHPISGIPLPDLPNETLRYNLCGNAFHMCGSGSVSGLNTGPARTDAVAQSAQALISEIWKIERRLDQANAPTTPTNPPPIHPVPPVPVAVEKWVKAKVASRASGIVLVEGGKDVAIDKTTTADMNTLLSSLEGKHVQAHVNVRPDGSVRVLGIAVKNATREAKDIQPATDDDSSIGSIAAGKVFEAIGSITAEEEAGGDLYYEVTVPSGGTAGDPNKGFVLASGLKLSKKPVTVGISGAMGQ
jgi:hypothetical protein